jgi:hypothetical protein
VAAQEQCDFLAFRHHFYQQTQLFKDHGRFFWYTEFWPLKKTRGTTEPQEIYPVDFMATFPMI